MTADKSHLVPLQDGWQLWKWFRLRGAGFPAEHARRLAAPDAVRTFDEYVERQEDRARAVDEAVALLEREIGELEADARTSRLAALRKLRRGKRPANSDLANLAPVHEAFEDEARAADAFAKAYEEDSTKITESLREFANDERLRQAIAWQNLAAYETALSRIESGKGAKKLRRAEQMLASYIQRYHLKNDTIGFFGPQGDGLLVPGSKRTAHAGDELLKLRKVHFEHWAVAALADALAADFEIGAYAYPRRLATFYLDGEALFDAQGEENPLSPEMAAVLWACDGKTMAKDIVSSILEQELPDVDDEDDVMGILESLLENDIITWTFPLQTATTTPELELEKMLQKIPGDVGDRARQKLEKLMRAKNAVGAASNDSQALALALSALNETFEQLTGASSTRNPGQTYGSRAIVYEECQRDYDLRLGDEFLELVSAPLQLVLHSARWFTHRMAELYEDAVLRAFDELTRESEDASIPFLQLWARIADQFGSEDAPAGITSTVKRELQERWQRVLGLDESERDVHRHVSALASAVAEHFAAPGPGWPSARYHSPDVLLITSSPGDIDSGIKTVVLGEVHAAMNTCGIRVFQDMHESRDEFIAARQRDLPTPAVVHVVAREQASRADHVWTAPHNVDLELGSTPSWRPPEQVLKVGELVVSRDNGQLRVKTRDGRWDFSIIEILENYLVDEASAAFSFLPKMRHRPRVTIGAVIIGRETWVFSPEELTFRDMPRGSDQFRVAREWARSHQLPPHVFVKIPEETKPMYIDLESPLYIEILSRLASKATSVTVSEMLPDIEEAWLSDSAGNRHTAELRLAAVDPISWKVPA